MASSHATNNLNRLRRLVAGAHLMLGRLHHTSVDTGRQVHRHIWPRRNVEFVRSQNVQASSGSVRRARRRSKHARTSHTQQQWNISKARRKRGHFCEKTGRKRGISNFPTPSFFRDYTIPVYDLKYSLIKSIREGN